MNKRTAPDLQVARPRPRYEPALIERAVRAVLESKGSQWAAIEATAKDVGCPTETLRRWVRRAETPAGTKPQPKASAAGKGARNGTKKPDPALLDAHPNNARLRELIQASGKTQDEALVIFNRGLKHRPYSTSTWKAFLATPGTERFRPLSDRMLQYAVTQFAKIKP